MQGGCACGAVKYQLTARPMFVHGCHCRWCQRETGAAFAVNALIETFQIDVVSGAPEAIETPSESGKGQRIVRCPDCKVALWSHYAGAGPGIAFIRVGALDDPDAFPPDIHIYVASKQPWLPLPEAVPAVPEYYRMRDHWPAAAIDRYKAARLS